MATAIPNVLFRGAASTSSTTLYTVPALTTTVVTSVVVNNTDSSAANFTLSLNGVVLVGPTSLAANSVATFDFRQTLLAGQTITGSATATTVNFHLSGMEIA